MNSKTDRKPQPAQIVTIDEGSAGQRIDNFLLRELKGLPKSRIYRILRKGEVRINGGRAKPQTKLHEGDKVRIPPIAHLQARDQAIGSFKDLDGLILHEDERLIVVNKPAGMAVHGGSGVSIGLIESLRHARDDRQRLELVHRLDRGTSGCLMIAKKKSYLRLLQEALRQKGSIRKYYLALTHGEWPQGITEIDEPLSTMSKDGQERITRVSAEGKPSLTRIRCLATGPAVSLLEAYPVTGRTHQIRVHTRWARHPIVGDDRYGDRVVDRMLPGVDRLMLHAARLEIPALGDFPPVSISAPMEESMLKFTSKQVEFDINSYLKQ